MFGRRPPQLEEYTTSAGAAATREVCETWAPCANATTCACEWFKGEYLCFEASGGWDAWRPAYRDYVDGLNLEALADWCAWRFGESRGFS